MDDKITQFANKIKADIPGYIGFSITEIKSGKRVYSNSIDKKFDIDAISSYNVDVVRAKLNAIDTLEKKDSIKNIIINLEHQIHVIDITKDKEFFFYIAVDAELANLGLILAVIKKCKKELSSN